MKLRRWTVSPNGYLYPTPADGEGDVVLVADVQKLEADYDRLQQAVSDRAAELIQADEVIVDMQNAISALMLERNALKEQLEAREPSVALYELVNASPDADLEYDEATEYRAQRAKERLDG